LSCIIIAVAFIFWLPSEIDWHGDRPDPGPYRDGLPFVVVTSRLPSKGLTERLEQAAMNLGAKTVFRPS